jgi:hypothetical protein
LADGLALLKTHDLPVLLWPCLALHPAWQAFMPDLELLSEYAVAFRYPGEWASQEDARCAVDVMKGLRRSFRSALGLAECDSEEVGP